MRVRLFIPVLLVAAACGGSDSSTTGPSSTNKTVDIFMIGNIFSPSFQTVAVGDTVRFNFAPGSDGMGHNVRFTPTVAGAPSDVSVLKTGTVSRAFATKGDFNYVCDVHPGMIGEIVVQ
jgi:plastocyanin